jgi:hypothetical protein
MAVSGYTGKTITKGALAVLGKVSATTFALTLGTAAVAVVAAAMLAAQMTDFKTWESEASDEKKQKTNQS